MSDVVRVIDDETSVGVNVSDDGERVRVQLGTGAESVTFVGDLSTIHRLFVEVDNQVSRLVTSPLASKRAVS